MAKQDWKLKRNKNPYITKSWINIKKGLLIEIHYDIGFKEQRNVTVYNYRKQLLSGYEELHTEYCDNQKEALAWAEDYISKN